MSFLDSVLFKKLENGELPEVSISISEETLIQLGAMLVLVGIALMLSFEIIKKIK